MRLIDADALRAKYQAILDRGDMFCEYDIVGMVDDAPTVEPDVNCSHCDYFKFTQTFIENIVKLMTDHNFESVDDLMNEINRVKDELGGRE